jgi:hypothetical protein
MLNLMIGGMLLGNRFGGYHSDRLMGANAVQLIPRKFIQDLPRARRQELLGFARGEIRGLRGLRDGSAEAVLKIADALEQDKGDLASVRLAVTDYMTGPQSLSTRGTGLIMGVIEKMTPEERKALALAIRDRAARAKSRRK